ncbi:hypothetical protein BFP97_01485 [Roseivirga sp. 4D4]|uniref:hypothetical protein n=1 Tax=Roseivirga sp. 4D4 TaxID=1889784 RepID=UPI00085343F4|nr:hypothetical protein [Roseivirga sp. 4D4]OEK00263.1 hypothetical protein BFP97_01485 [Roseivirga sp. 4D4]
MPTKKFRVKQFIIVVLITSIWINASEILRYFLLVMPMMKDYWGGVDHRIAEMDGLIFSIWGLWDTLLTGVLVFVVWLYTQFFGSSNRSIIFSSSLVWAAVFVIFWVATSNMGLSNWGILLVALPLSWVEMVIGGWISVKLYSSRKWKTT